MLLCNKVTCAEGQAVDFQLFGNRKMPLFSAIEDLRYTTLRSISGLLARLDYLSGLRGVEGTYGHWGFSRLHGEATAQQALGEAHRATLSGILRTPLRRLMDDVDVSAESQGGSPEQYVENLSSRSPELLPAHPGAGADRHLSAVLHALSKLLKTR